MAHIYKSCSCAIIWLGVATQPLALRLVQQESPSDALELTNNGYFKRLWIVQEILLSPRQCILCGKVWMQTDDIVKYLDPSFQDAPWWEGDSFRTYCIFYGSLKAETLTLKQVLELFGQNQCEDVRDKVYGLMSLVRPEERVLVDYQRTKEEIFFDLATQLLKGPDLSSTLSWLETFAGHMGLDRARELLSERFPSCHSILPGDDKIRIGDLPEKNIIRYDVFRSEARHME